MQIIRQVSPYSPVTTNPNEEPNFLSQLMSSGPRRRRFNAGGNNGNGVTSVADKTTIPTANIVAEDMTRETQIRLEWPFLKFFICIFH